jgi:hypothetical protein
MFWSNPLRLVHMNDRSNNRHLTSRSVKKVYNFTLRHTTDDFHNVMNTPDYFDDFKQYATKRYAGESFQFLKAIRECRALTSGRNMRSAELVTGGEVCDTSDVLKVREILEGNSV